MVYFNSHIGNRIKLYFLFPPLTYEFCHTSGVYKSNVTNGSSMENFSLLTNFLPIYGLPLS